MEPEPTSQGTYYLTEELRGIAIQWLIDNLDANDFLVSEEMVNEPVQENGPIFYSMLTWFRDRFDAYDWYAAVGNVMFDPWYVEPEDPEDPPEEG